MSEQIAYTTVEEQLSKLKAQQLIINDDNLAKQRLKSCGYSNLIKSYRDPYIIHRNETIIYRSGVSFDQIYSLYLLDKNLRNSVMAAMQDLEEHIKENAASVIAQSFGVDHNDYLMFRNYRNKRKTKSRFMLTNILNTLKQTVNTDRDPIHHYNTKYNTVPPWILFKSIYFSTIVNFIDLFKQNDKLNLANLLYDCNELNLQYEQLCKLMMDTLYICLDYRNVAAHGGRIYNYQGNPCLHFEDIFGADKGTAPFGFSELLFLLSLFKYKRPFYVLENTLSQELQRHCNKYPQDITYLGQILNINIIPTQTVYVSKRTKKYHLTQYCSGMNNAKKMELDKAKQQGYILCKRCQRCQKII